MGAKRGDNAVTIRFAVESLSDRGESACHSEAARPIIEALKREFPDAVFDAQWRVFVVALDPVRQSFADVRNVVRRVGEAGGNDYLAVVMSP